MEITNFTRPSDITPELQPAIDRLASSGGGEIRLPSGTFGFTPLRLRSGICLNVGAGTTLVASGKREDYFPVGYHHNEMKDVYSAIYAMDDERITLKGEGVIDLNGRSFYRFDKPSEVFTSGPAITQEHIDEAPRTYDWRVNQPLFFLNCRNLRVENLKVVDAPCWTFSFCGCQTISIRGLTIENSLILPNNDGLHFSASRDISVSDCHITAGDDCIALSCITDFSAACEDVVVSNCVFKSASKALSIGFMHSIVRNVLIENVIVRRSNRAFAIMCHPGTGLVENVRVANCLFEGRSYGGNWWGNGESIVLMASPQHLDHFRDPEPERRFDHSIRNVSFTHCVCRSPRPVAVVATEPVVDGIAFTDMTVEITPDDLPSLKGNAIDLAPGPENLVVPGCDVGVVIRNASVRCDGIRDPAGQDVRIARL